MAACDPEVSKQITQTVEDAIALVSKVNLLDLIRVRFFFKSACFFYYKSHDLKENVVAN